MRAERQTAQGEDGLHQGADPRAGGRVRPPQLPDPTTTLRDRRQSRPHRETSMYTPTMRFFVVVVLEPLCSTCEMYCTEK